MTDDAQPAAAQAGQGAPRLSEERLNEIIERLAIDCALNEGDSVALLAELDATRADLQEARSEAERLKAAIIQPWPGGPGFWCLACQSWFVNRGDYHPNCPLMHALYATSETVAEG